MLLLLARPALAADYADQGAAYAGCKAAETAYPHEGYSRAPDSCVEVFSANGRLEYQCFVSWQGGPTYRYSCGYLSGVHDQGSHTFPSGANCLSRPEQTGWQASSQQVCFNGCTYHLYNDPSTGQNYYSTFKEGAPTSGGVCQVSDYPPPELDTDGDGIPDDEDAFPNDPNESQDTDGDGIGDNADFSPNDPTDGSDEPGDEDGDDEGDNTASGGGDCKAPPSCKGDGIQCNQLFQQWQIRCSGATVTGDPTNCSSGYSCSGDSVQCATVALLRKTACATAGNGDGGTGGSPGDANGNGVADVLEGSGAGDTGDPGESDNVTRFGIGVDASLLDQENIFGGGSCPTPPSFTIMGKTISGSDFPYWCQAMAILRALILIFGAFTAVKILTGWGFS
ncbi:virulence factor TspB C-terminal domain-related protein [Pseudoxanthomonas mexicana]